MIEESKVVDIGFRVIYEFIDCCLLFEGWLLRNYCKRFWPFFTYFVLMFITVFKLKRNLLRLGHDVEFNRKQLADNFWQF